MSHSSQTHGALSLAQLCEPATERRVFKTHAPRDLFPCKELGAAKIVYVARNPKDACVSVQRSPPRAPLKVGGFSSFSSFFNEANRILNFVLKLAGVLPQPLDPVPRVRRSVGQFRRALLAGRARTRLLAKRDRVLTLRQREQVFCS